MSAPPVCLPVERGRGGGQGAPRTRGGREARGIVSAILRGSVPEDSRYIREGRRPIDVKVLAGSWFRGR